jgi:hypothetical protein
MFKFYFLHGSIHVSWYSTTTVGRNVVEVPFIAVLVKWRLLLSPRSGTAGIALRHAH